jgi:hypothetical protein
MKTMERALATVPRPALALLVIALFVQIGWQALQPKPSASADALENPPSLTALRGAGMGEPISHAQLLTLYVQAFDNQPGVSIPFLDLDYARVRAWLATILELDPLEQYPLMMAAHLYGQVPDSGKQREMCEFVRLQFSADPNRRWRWLAHCAIMAKHRLKDVRLALSYAEAITREARHASGWARQMQVFILEDMGEREAATVLLGGLLAGGEATEPAEIHFLTQRLEELKGAGNSSGPSKK